MTENIVTGKSYRILKDKGNDIWDRVSFWTHATDVEMENGKNLQEELSDTIATINGTVTTKINALETSLNSTIANRLTPLEQQVATNKNSISSLNTGLANTNSTIGSLSTSMNNMNSDLQRRIAASQMYILWLCIPKNDLDTVRPGERSMFRFDSSDGEVRTNPASPWGWTPNPNRDINTITANNIGSKLSAGNFLTPHVAGNYIGYSYRVQLWDVSGGKVTWYVVVTNPTQSYDSNGICLNVPFWHYPFYN